MVQFAILNSIMISMALYLWFVFDALAEDLDDMLGSDRAVQIGRWLILRQRGSPQGMAAAVGAVTGPVFLAAVSGGVSPHLEIRAGSYITAAVTGGLSANGLYFLVVMLYLIYKCYKVRPANLIWHSPADTPAIRKLCVVVLQTSLFFSAGIAASEIFVLVVPSHGSSATFRVFLVLFPLLGVLMALLVVLIGMSSIALIVRQSKFESLAHISNMIGPITWLGVDRDTVKENLLIHDALHNKPLLPISSTAYIPYSAALIAPLLTFLIARFARQH